MKIILATDFSKGNEMLAPYALDLLKDTGGTILLVHAYAKHENDKRDEADAESQQTMEKVVALLNKSIEDQNIKDINIEQMLVGGDPIEGLLHTIRQEKADLVLIGAHGRGNKYFLEGKVAKSLMAKSPVPLLSIHEDYQYQKNSEMLYVTNFDRSDSDIIPRIFMLLKPFNIHLHVLHFILDSDPQKSAKSMKKLEENMKYTEFNGNICYRMIYTVNAKDAMKTYCMENGISLAAFIPHRRHFFDFFYKDKFTKEDFYNLNIPLLIFRNKANS